jgi:hypothetical protein
MIVIIEESRFETVPPGRRRFVMLRKRHATGIIVIIEESWFETIPLGDDRLSCYARGMRRASSSLSRSRGLKSFPRATTICRAV